MKRKLILMILTVLLIGLMAYTFVACDSVVTVESITLNSISEETISYQVGAFKYDDYSVKVTFSDGKVEDIPLTEAMISDYDKLKLNKVGKQTITITYKNKTLELVVNITKKEIDEKQYTKPYLEDIDVVYDGTAHTISVQGDLPENAQVYYPQNRSFTNAGIYEVSAVIYAENYETITLKATVNIRKATYDMSDVKMVVDYGKDNEGNALTAFTYDGAEHSAVVKGNIPAGLTYKYYIGTVQGKLDTYKEGNSAVHAGTYYVYALFTGDAKNYNTDNLSIYTSLIINKKSYVNDQLKDIKFEDKTFIYDGVSSYRLQISAVTLPQGMRVEYVDEEGNTFGSRMDANEEGYKVTAKFILENERDYELANDLHATLYIKKANYPTEQIKISLSNNTLKTTYNAEPQMPTVENIPEGLTFEGFKYNDEWVTSFTDAGTYDLTAYFSQTNPNYNDVAPITVEFIINAASFGEKSVLFNSLTKEYGGTYSLSYQIKALPIGVTYDLSYVDSNDGMTYEGIPENITEVGTYIATITYNYNSNNYYNSKDLGEDVATLTITTRVFDAENDNVVKVENVNFDFAEKDYISNLSYYAGATGLPNWVTEIGLTVWNPDGIITKKIYNAGEYQYRYGFKYFNGKENVTCYTKYATCYIKGIQFFMRSDEHPDGKYELFEMVNNNPLKIVDEYTKQYDGKTCEPVYNLYFSQDLNPQFIWTSYQYKAPDSDDYISVNVESELSVYSKKAGTHILTYKVWAFNYEPIKGTINITVSPKEITVDTSLWHTQNYVGIYDNENHRDQITRDDTQDEFQLLITGVPELYEKTPESGDIDGYDVGVYKYKLHFGTSDSNYVAKLIGSETEKNYEVTITRLNLTDEELDGHVDQNFNPFKIMEYDWTIGTSGGYAEVTGTINKSETINENTIFGQFAKDYADDLNKIFYTEYKYDFNGWAFDISLDSKKFDLTKKYQKVAETLFKSAKYTIFKYSSNGTYEQLLLNAGYLEMRKDLDSDDTYGKYVSAGSYYVFIKFEDNMVINQSSYYIFKIIVDYYQFAGFDNPVESWSNSTTKTEMEIATKQIFSISDEKFDNDNNVTAFENAPMIVYETSYSASVINFNLTRTMHEILQYAINENPLYMAYRHSATENIKHHTLGFTNGSDILFEGKTTTVSGIYYFFLTLNSNLKYNSSNRVVFKITVNSLSLESSKLYYIKLSEQSDHLPKTAETRVDINELTGFYDRPMYEYSIGYDDIKNDALIFDERFLYNYPEKITSSISLAPVPYAFGMKHEINKKNEDVYSPDTECFIYMSSTNTSYGKTYALGNETQECLVQHCGYYYFCYDTGNENVLIDGKYQKLVICVIVEASNNYKITYNGEEYDLRYRLPNFITPWAGAKQYQYEVPLGKMGLTDIAQLGIEGVLDTTDNGGVMTVNDLYTIGIVATNSNYKVKFNKKAFAGAEYSGVYASIQLTTRTIDVKNVIMNELNYRMDMLTGAVFYKADSYYDYYLSDCYSTFKENNDETYSIRKYWKQYSADTDGYEPYDPFGYFTLLSSISSENLKCKIDNDVVHDIYKSTYGNPNVYKVLFDSVAGYYLDKVENNYIDYGEFYMFPTFNYDNRDNSSDIYARAGCYRLICSIDESYQYETPIAGSGNKIQISIDGFEYLKYMNKNSLSYLKSCGLYGYIQKMGIKLKYDIYSAAYTTYYTGNDWLASLKTDGVLNMDNVLNFVKTNYQGFDKLFEGIFAKDFSNIVTVDARYVSNGDPTSEYHVDKFIDCTYNYYLTFDVVLTGKYTECYQFLVQDNYYNWTESTKTSMLFAFRVRMMESFVDVSGLEVFKNGYIYQTINYDASKSLDGNIYEVVKGIISYRANLYYIENGKYIKIKDKLGNSTFGYAAFNGHESDWLDKFVSKDADNKLFTFELLETPTSTDEVVKVAIYLNYNSAWNRISTKDNGKNFYVKTKNEDGDFIDYTDSGFYLTFRFTETTIKGKDGETSIKNYLGSDIITKVTTLTSNIINSRNNSFTTGSFAYSNDANIYIPSSDYSTSSLYNKDDKYLKSSWMDCAVVGHATLNRGTNGNLYLNVIDTIPSGSGFSFFGFHKEGVGIYGNYCEAQDLHFEQDGSTRTFQMCYQVSTTCVFVKAYVCIEIVVKL